MHVLLFWDSKETEVEEKYSSAHLNLWSMAFLVLGAVSFPAILRHQLSNAFRSVYLSGKINTFSSLMD